MVINTQPSTSKITVVLPKGLKDEVSQLKERLHTSMNAIYQTAIAEYIARQKKAQLRRDAEQMLHEYQNDPELQELSGFQEDVYVY